MLQLKVNPPTLKEVLFDVDFGLGENTLNKQRKVSSAGEISTLLGKKNRLSVGIPETWNLIDLFKEKGVDIPAEVELLLDEYDFYQVRFVCTFKPDKNCKFVWARFGLKLFSIDEEKGNENKFPVAHDIFPKEVYEEVKVRRNFSIGPNFQYKDFAQVGISSRSEQEFIRYEPEIISYGLLQPDPCWDFKKSRARDFIIGDKELFMILKAPKGMDVEVKFEFGAEVHTFLGLLPMIPIRIYKGESLVEGRYMISAR